MNEKLAVDDVLESTHTIITQLEYSIEQANNKQFRDTLIQFRNKLENVNWEVYTLAKEKQYYIPAAPAGAADIEQVKNVVCKNK